jgi:GTPase SAR1 family protein
MELLCSEGLAAPEKLFKVIVIGDPTVGKTSFVQRYVQHSYRRDYKGTVGVDFALKVVKCSEAPAAKLQLWDIAGKNRSSPCSPEGEGCADNSVALVPPRVNYTD